MNQILTAWSRFDSYDIVIHFILSQLISIIGYVLFWFLFVPGKPYLFLFALPFHSFGIGSLFTIMMSMTADICDLDELENGKRREGVLGAVYWWMVKLGTALAMLTSGVVLQMVGFDDKNKPKLLIIEDYILLYLLVKLLRINK